VNFSATIRQVGHVSVVVVTGKLTSLETGALSNSIAQLLNEGRKQILLNLRGLTYLDSSGIGDLVRTYMSVIKRGGEMKVVGLTDKAEEILKITKLYQVFQEFQDERSALQSFPDDGGGKRKTALEIVPPHKN
jgi:anti-sigma B factor antagonist